MIPGRPVFPSLRAERINEREGSPCTITDAFDTLSPAIINPEKREDAPAVDACIVTFTHEIEKHVAENYAAGEIASLWCATRRTQHFCFFIELVKDLCLAAQQDRYSVRLILG